MHRSGLIIATFRRPDASIYLNTTIVTSLNLTHEAIFIVILLMADVCHEANKVIWHGAKFRVISFVHVVIQVLISSLRQLWVNKVHLFFPHQYGIGSWLKIHFTPILLNQVIEGFLWFCGCWTDLFGAYLADIQIFWNCNIFFVLNFVVIVPVDKDEEIGGQVLRESYES